MKDLRIGELAQLTLTPPSALRYYEQIGVLPAARREAGQRRYGEDAAVLVLAIKLAIRAGFSLTEIRRARVSGGGALPPGWQQLLGRKLLENEEAQRRLRRSHELLEKIASCGCSSLMECELVGNV